MDVRSDIRTFIQDNFMMAMAGFELGDGDSLLGTSVIDSTGVLELVTFLEGHFQMKVEDAEMLPENLDSVEVLTAFVERKLAVGKEA